MRRWLGFAALACVAFGVRAQDLVVYDDVARNGFDGAFSFGGDVDLANTTPVFVGTTSIAYTGNAGFNAVAFARPGPPDLVTTQYHTLRFFVHGGTTGGQQLRLYVQRDAETGETLVAQGELDPYIVGGAIVAGAWREVRVPLAAFGVTGGFDRIDLQTDVGAQPVLYLDEIVLLGKPTIAIDRVTVSQGATSVRVPVRFLAGSQPVAGFQGNLAFTRGTAIQASATVVAEPGSFPNASPSCGGPATSQPTATTLVGLAVSPNLSAISSGTICTFTFPLNPSAPLGSYPISFSTPPGEFIDAASNPVLGDFVQGAIVVATGTAPTLSYTPSPPTQIDLPGGALGASVQSSVSVQSNGGSGVGAVQLSCAVGQPFVLFDQDEFTLTAGGDPVSIDIACDLAGTEAVGTLSCNETDLPGGTTRLREWPLRCPAGSAATIAAGTVTGNRNGPVAVPITLIGDGTVFSAVGDVVFDRARLTPTQVSPANGGNCFLRPAPNDNRIAFNVPPGPGPLAQQQTTYCNLVFVLADDAPIESTPLTLSSTTCLDGANAAATCLTTDGAVVTSGFDSSPRPGAALTLTALPGQPAAAGSILAINFGTTGIPVTSCSPDPATGFTIDPNGAFTIGATAFRSLNVGCTPPAAGLPPRVSDLSCLLQDTNPARVVRYRLVCAAAAATGPIAGSSLLGSGAGAGDEVGSALASTLTANGEEITVIGAPFAGTDDGGRAFVVVRAPGAGTFGADAKRAGGGLLHDALEPGAAHLLSATTALGDKFGSAVAINSAGDRIAVGAPGAGPGFAGRVFVFERPVGGWTTLDIPAQTLEAPSGPAAQDVTPDDFGAQVAFTQGDMLVVGAPLSDLGAGATVDAGAAFVYPAGAVAPTAVMRSPSIETGAQFGSAIAGNGGSVAFGAPLENAASNADRGAVYVMSAPGAPVEPTQRIVAAGGGIGDKFGRSVAYVGRTLVVGAPEDDTNTGTDAGSATVFNGDTSTGFIERVTFTPPGGALQQAGTAVATNGDIVLLGAPLANVDGRAAQGRVFAFDLPEGAIVASPVATAIDGAAGQSGDRFGAFLANSPRRLIVGVPKDDNELGIGGTSVQVDEGRADPFLFDRILRVGFE